MKIIKPLAFMVFVGFLGCFMGTGCVSPFYGTARIEKGFHADAGLALTSFPHHSPYSDFDYDICYGARADAELRYGFFDYFQLNGRLGLGMGYSLASGSTSMPPEPAYIGYCFDAKLGFQAAFPLGWFTPALRIEGGEYISMMPVFGLGKRELLTIGGKIDYIYTEGGVVPDEIFVTFHPTDRVSVSAGVSMIFFEFKPWIPCFVLGVGYKLK